jgi:hypothetical protein
MLRRLIAWCVPNRVPEDRDREAEMTDVVRVLAPYRDEPVAPVLRLADPVRD